MKHLILLSIIVFFYSCKTNRVKSLESYYFKNKRNLISNLISYNGKVTYTSRVIGKSDSIIDSALVFGFNKEYLCLSSTRIFFSDNKYFFNIYPSKKVLYNDLNKLRVFRFLDVYQVLKYLNLNNKNFEVTNAGKSLKYIRVQMNPQNYMNCDFVNLLIDENQNDLCVKEINYIANSFDRKSGVETHIYIKEMHLNCSNDKDAFKPMYEEVKGEIILKDTLKNYKLIKVY